MEYAPLGIAVILALILFVSAWRFGVINQLSGSLAAAGGIFSGLLCFSMFPGLADSTIGLKLPNIVVVVIALVIGVFAMILLKLLLRGILRALFNADSPLHNMSDGFFGAMISLIPIAILLFVMASGLRMVGTLMELRMATNITRPNINWSEKSYPKWPITAQWRDEIEAIPVVSGILGMVDPISKKHVRNLAGLLIASKNPGLKGYLKQNPATSGIFASTEFAELLADETVTKLNEENNRPGLLQNATLQSTAFATAIRSDLRKLDLQKTIDDYMLSPEKLADSETRRRPIDPKAKPSGSE